MVFFVGFETQEEAQAGTAVNGRIKKSNPKQI